MRELKIGIDLDGVVFDTVGEVIRRYNQDYDDCLTKEDIKSWETANYVKCGEEIYRYFNDPEFYLDLPVLEGALEVLKRLDDRHEIVLISDTPAWGVYNRSKQLDKLFPKNIFSFMQQKNIIYTARKDLVMLDILLDDKPENIEDFNRAGMGRAVIFDWPYNRHLEGYSRILNWWDFEQLIDLFGEKTSYLA